MLPGRQSHINQKSKEFWFYEHFHLFDETKHKTCVCYNIAIFLNFLCFKYTDWRFLSNTYAHGPLCSLGKRHICFLTFTLAKSKKGETSLLWLLKQNSKEKMYHEFIPCTLYIFYKDLMTSLFTLLKDNF